MSVHLSQVIAIEKDIKARAAQVVSGAEGKFAKANLLAGLSRKYSPREEEGEQLPAERTSVQVKVSEVLDDVREALLALFDTTATKDYANCAARASITIDGRVLVPDVPATCLLFLEKQLTELLGFIKKIPMLDPAEEWHYDEGQDCYATSPAETVRTKKVLQRMVLAEATKEHPAQVQVYQEDVPTGRWMTIKFSGAMPAREINEMQARIVKLQQAVKFAREEANRSEVRHQHVGDPLLQYVLGK